MTIFERFQPGQVVLTDALNAILAAIEALEALGAQSYQGSWNAATNTPTLVSGEGVKGFYYSVSVEGTTLIDGVSAWGVGDKISFNGTIWEKFVGSEAVTRVAGLTGDVSAATLKTALGIAASDVVDASVPGRAILKGASYTAIKALLAVTAGDISGLGGLATKNNITASLISDASPNAQSLIAAADYVAMRALLGVQAALGFTPLNKAGDTLTGPVVLSGDPTLPLHPATKQYVDAAIYHLDSKQSCRFAAATNINIASAPATIDGGTPDAGIDRIVLLGQTNGAENGIYVWNGAGVAMTRALDMASWSNIPGAFVAVEEGLALADTSWICTSNKGGTLGTSAITWQQATTATAGVTSFGGRTGAVALISADVAAALGYTAMDAARKFLGGGLATGGGDGTTDRTITVEKAAGSDVRAGSSDAMAVTPKAAYDAMAEVTLTAISNVVTPNFTAGNDFALAMTFSGTLANPSAVVVGKKGHIRVAQDAAGSRTLVYGSSYKWVGGAAGVLSTAPNSIDYIDFEIRSPTEIRLSLSKAWG